MKQSKKCIKWKYKLLAVSLAAILLLSYTFYECNRLLEPVMIAVAKQEVQSSLNKLIHNCISVLDFNPDDLIRVKTNEEGEILSLIHIYASNFLNHSVNLIKIYQLMIEITQLVRYNSTWFVIQGARYNI